MTQVSLICSLIARHQSQFYPTVVSYGFENTDDATPVSCASPSNHLAFGNFTDLISIVAKGFGEHWMYFVVFSPSATRWLLDRGDQLEPYALKLGYSRFILQTNDTFEQVRDRLPEFFHCLLLLVSETSVDVPAHFSHCSKRRFLSPTDEVEFFSEKKTSLICPGRCSSKATKKADKAFVEQFRRFLNVTSVTTVPLDPKQPFVTMTRSIMEYLNMRKAESSLIPHFVKYHRLQLTTYVYPTSFFDYELLSWRQRQQMMTATGLIKMFDSWTWAGILSYGAIQVLLMAVIMRNSSDAFILVVGTFLTQGVTMRKGRLWKFNFSFLMFAGFLFGIVACNILKAYLNIQYPIRLTTAADLAWAFKKKMVTTVCVGRRENHAATVRNPEKLEGFMGFVRDAKKLGTLYESEDTGACVPFVLSSRKHTAVLIRAKAFVVTTYARAVIHVGRDTGQSQILSHLVAPWAPHRKLIDGFFLMTLETENFFEYEPRNLKTVLAQNRLKIETRAWSHSKAEEKSYKIGVPGKKFSRFFTLFFETFRFLASEKIDKFT